MQDHNQPIDPQDLSSRLDRLKKSHSFPRNGVSGSARVCRVGTTSSASSSTHTFSHLPAFSKSPTMSTTTSDDSRPELLGGAVPTAQVQRRSAEVGPGGFSKPRAGGARRAATAESESQSSKSVPEFRYYGRHANAWLFNDWSIVDSVKKGWHKVAPTKNEH